MQVVLPLPPLLPYLPSLFPSHPFLSFCHSLPSPLEVGTPQLRLGGLGVHKFSQRVRAEPGHQTHSDAFYA